MRVLAIVGLVLFVSLLVQPAVSQVTDDKLIVPGVRIGKWTLEMTMNDLLKMNGPRKGYASHPDVGLSPWFNFVSPTTQHLWLPLACFYALTHGRDSQKVIALGIGYIIHGAPYACTAAEAYKTAKPLYSWDALEAAFGKANTTKVAARESLLIFDNVGLAAWVRDSSRISYSFLVFRPGTAKSIWKY